MKLLAPITGIIAFLLCCNVGYSQKRVSLKFEVFSAPQLTARKAVIKNPNQTDLHKWLTAQAADAQSGIKLENLMLLTTLSGQRAKIAAAIEFPHPVDFDPPQVPSADNSGAVAPAQTAAPAPTAVTMPPTPPVPTPNPPTPPTPPSGNQGDPGILGLASTGGDGWKPPFPYIPATPTSFEVTNLGWSIEVEAVISEDGKWVDLQAAPEFDSFVRWITWDKHGEIEQPVFSVQRFIPSITCRDGQPMLCGTMNPARNTGVAFPEEQGKAPQPPRVWLAFVTANITEAK